MGSAVVMKSRTAGPNDSSDFWLGIWKIATCERRSKHITNGWTKRQGIDAVPNVLGKKTAFLGAGRGLAAVGLAGTF
jgi:hypothetical protein